MGTQTHKLNEVSHIGFNNVTAEEARALLNTLGRRRKKAKAEESEEEAEEAEESEESEEEESEDDGEESEESEESEETEDSEEEEEEEESEEESDDDEDGEDNGKEAAVSWNQLKAVIDKYGDSQPKKMKTVLASFNIKNTAELKQAKKKWSAVHRKVLATFKKK